MKEQPERGDRTGVSRREWRVVPKWPTWTLRISKRGLTESYASRGSSHVILTTTLWSHVITVQMGILSRRIRKAKEKTQQTVQHFKLCLSTIPRNCLWQRRAQHHFPSGRQNQPISGWGCRLLLDSEWNRYKSCKEDSRGPRDIQQKLSLQSPMPGPHFLPPEKLLLSASGTYLHK